ncbi:hypothetical protein PENSTE_c011G05552 [Penicillium steckii]|uniref:Uncharacterized protein n=1 Tax=Penicillium steckii TaxID=303698 RepID=A0A1V6T673_9EURO|nr:hypothetical protein PENSTE_c011G05552 [Penicillium steckii]
MPNSQQPRTPPKSQHNTPPSYEELSDSIVIGPDGQYKTLTPEESALRDQHLKQAVLEKMLGLPRTAKFDWHASAHDNKQPSCPPAYSTLDDDSSDLISFSPVEKPVSGKAENEFKINYA